MNYLEYHATRCGLPEDHWKHKRERITVESNHSSIFESGGFGTTEAKTKAYEYKNKKDC